MDGASELASFALAEDGTRLHVRYRQARAAAGTNPPVAILSDGLACDGFVFGRLLDDLRDEMAVAHWNYRGHGRSQQSQTRSWVKVEDQARDLDQVRRHLGHEEVVLIGHSYGVQVCLEAFRLRPQGVRAMVLLCGAAGGITRSLGGSPLLGRAVPWLRELATEGGPLLGGVARNLPGWLLVGVGRVTGEIRPERVPTGLWREYFAHAAHLDPATVFEMLEYAGFHDASVLLPQIDVPVLVVAGARDRITPLERAKQLAEGIPDARFLVVEDASHVLPVEAPEVLAESVKQFLGSLGAATSSSLEADCPVSSTQNSAR